MDKDEIVRKILCELISACSGSRSISYKFAGIYKRDFCKNFNLILLFGMIKCYASYIKWSIVCRYYEELLKRFDDGRWDEGDSKSLIVSMIRLRLINVSDLKLKELNNND